LLDDTPRDTGSGIRLLMLAGDVYVLDENAVVIDAQHGAPSAFVFAGDHDDFITLSNAVHVR
jgi:hypothetical protein